MPLLKLTLTRDNTANSWAVVTTENLKNGMFTDREIASLAQSRDAMSSLNGLVDSQIQFIDDYTYVATFTFNTIENTNQAYQDVMYPAFGTPLYDRQKIMEEKRRLSGANYQALWEIIE